MRTQFWPPLSLGLWRLTPLPPLTSFLHTHTHTHPPCCSDDWFLFSSWRTLICVRRGAGWWHSSEPLDKASVRGGRWQGARLMCNTSLTISDKDGVCVCSDYKAPAAAPLLTDPTGRSSVTRGAGVELQGGLSRAFATGPRTVRYWRCGPYCDQDGLYGRGRGDEGWGVSYQCLALVACVQLFRHWRGGNQFPCDGGVGWQRKELELVMCWQAALDVNEPWEMVLAVGSIHGDPA